MDSNLVRYIALVVGAAISAVTFDHILNVNPVVAELRRSNAELQRTNDELRRSGDGVVAELRRAAAVHAKEEADRKHDEASAVRWMTQTH
jgi:hypothetical protein